jgi:hypothetical protein
MQYEDVSFILMINQEVSNKREKEMKQQQQRTQWQNRR